MVSPAVTSQEQVQARLTPAEREALERLRTRLHEVLRADQLRSLILYGSKARGESSARSDIDLLIVYDHLTPEQEECLAGVVDDFTSEPMGEIFQIVRKSHAEIARLEGYGEPIAQNIQREGILIEGEPIRVKNIDKPRLVAEALAHARESLEASESDLQANRYHKAIANSYYVYLHGARAALLAQGITPQTHSGTQTLFSLHFIKPKLVPAKFAPIYKRMLEERFDAEYNYEIRFGHEEAERAIDRAREFLAVIETLVPALLSGN